MHSRSRFRHGAAAASALALSLVGCGGFSGESGGSHGGPDFENITTINGEVPPNRIAKTIESSPMISTLDGLGNEVHVVRSVRAVGTRTPIHVHEHGGITCVVEGEMTLYMEGAAPMRAPQGQCYFMPPGTPMDGVNTGDTDTVMHDIFTIPEGTPIWTVIEAGHEETQDEFDESRADITPP
jgi:quercetin dioxygenase-like cupin family protein